MSTVEFLRGVGHNAVGLFCAEEMIEQWHNLVPDIYIIDVNLPGESGLSLTQRIREAYPLAGILVTTAQTTPKIRAISYHNGADAFLTKPVANDEILSVLNTLGRRIKGHHTKDVIGLHLDVKREELTGPNGCVRLTHSETNLLSKFVIAPSKTLERWEAMEILGGNRGPVSASSLEVRIGILRKKVCEAFSTEIAIKSIRGYGYKLCLPIKIL